MCGVGILVQQTSNRQFIIRRGRVCEALVLIEARTSTTSKFHLVNLVNHNLCSKFGFVSYSMIKLLIRRTKAHLYNQLLSTSFVCELAELGRA